MEKKINIVEILKNCPSDMELNCMMYENVFFDKIEENIIYPIRCYTLNNGIKSSINFTAFGTYSIDNYAKCIIFPKGKTTWEGFVLPCKFKAGDIITDKSDGSICIFAKEGIDIGTVGYYCGVDSFDNFYINDQIYDPANYDSEGYFGYIKNQRLATEEEKEKLFKAIKDNGCKWNPDMKTLEDLIELKFKVGDKIRCKTTMKQRIITKMHRDCYECDDRYILTFENQDNWELIPNKFDISTLVPFESKVLVRHYKHNKWCGAFFSFIHDDAFGYKFITIGGHGYPMMIPYEGNEHLLGTTEDCDEYYKTWE